MNRLRKPGSVVALLLASMILAACNSSGSDDTASGDEPSALIDGTLKYTEGSSHPDGEWVYGYHSGVMDKRLTVIRDINTFTSLWAEHTSVVSPQPPLPEVLFGSEMLVATFAGTRPSGGYRMEIISIEEFDQRIDVTVELGVPGESCVTSEALTQPYHMVVIPDSNKTVMFNEYETVDEC